MPVNFTGGNGSLALALFVALPLGAQPPAVTFRSETALAMLRFHVMRNGSFVDDLRPDDIDILDDGVRRPVAVFEGGRYFHRTIPVELALLFDCSGSIQNAGLLDARVFDAALFRRYPQLSISVYGFTDAWRRVAAPTRDVTALNRAAADVAGTAPGSTRLFEAVIGTVRDAAARAGNVSQTVVIFSDAVAPPEAQAEAIRAAREAGVVLYPVLLGKPLHGLVDSVEPVGARPAFANPFAKMLSTFTRLGSETGGRDFHAGSTSPAVLSEILGWIMAQLDAEYLAGFYPPEGSAARPRYLEIVLRDRNRGEVKGGVRTLGP